jgi:predicted phage gp36 major capsid-like protein
MPIIETVEQLADFLEQNEEWRRRIYSILVPRELARLPAEFDEFRAETRREFDSMRAEMRKGFEQLRAEIRAGDEQIRAEMRENSERVEQKIQKNTDAIAKLKGGTTGSSCAPNRERA